MDTSCTLISDTRKNCINSVITVETIIAWNQL